jgi:hypothetical protein
LALPDNIFELLDAFFAFGDTVQEVRLVLFKLLDFGGELLDAFGNR